MGNQVHKRRAIVVLAAFVVAAAVPVTLPLSRDATQASAEVVTTPIVSKVIAENEAGASMPFPSFAAESDRTDAAAQAASMMLVGTLLIGIGSAVRRAM